MSAIHTMIHESLFSDSEGAPQSVVSMRLALSQNLCKYMWLASSIWLSLVTSLLDALQSRQI